MMISSLFFLALNVALVGSRLSSTILGYRVLGEDTTSLTGRLCTAGQGTFGIALFVFLAALFFANRIRSMTLILPLSLPRWWQLPIKGKLDRRCGSQPGSPRSLKIPPYLLTNVTSFFFFPRLTGNKKANITVIYTPWDNLKVRPHERPETRFA